jgi:hypothetical protein
MTILDGALQFSGVAGTAGATGQDSPTTGTTFSTNVIDLLNARDMGIGDDPALKILAEVTVAFAGGTSLQLSIQGSVDNATYVTLATGPAILDANLIQGTHLLDIDLPRIAGALPDRPGATMALPRYLRLSYINVGVHTGGSLWAGIVLDREDQIAYPPGIIINN